MACRIEITPHGRKSILALPNASVGEKVRGWIERIAADPDRQTEGYAHDVRVADGMVLTGRGGYYVRISYTHITGSDLVTILRITAQLSSGPH